jgi:hypothetical protein
VFVIPPPSTTCSFYGQTNFGNVICTYTAYATYFEFELLDDALSATMNPKTISVNYNIFKNVTVDKRYL